VRASTDGGLSGVSGSNGGMNSGSNGGMSNGEADVERSSNTNSKSNNTNSESNNAINSAAASYGVVSRKQMTTDERRALSEKERERDEQSRNLS
jgi:hypothetical protein